jgi:hypothetical protein
MATTKQSSLQPSTSTQSLDNCSICSEPLVILSAVASDDTDEQEILDDVLLRCGDHFHWECITSHYMEAGDKNTCPSCAQLVTDEQGRLLVNVTNEGGVTNGFDLGAEIVRRTLVH